MYALVIPANIITDKEKNKSNEFAENKILNLLISQETNPKEKINIDDGVDLDPEILRLIQDAERAGYGEEYEEEYDYSDQEDDDQNDQMDELNEK